MVVALTSNDWQWLAIAAIALVLLFGIYRGR